MTGGLLAVLFPIRADGGFEFAEIGTSRFRNDFFGEAILVGVRLQVGRIGVQNPSADPLALHRP